MSFTHPFAPGLNIEQPPREKAPTLMLRVIDVDDSSRKIQYDSLDQGSRAIVVKTDNRITSGDKDIDVVVERITCIRSEILMHTAAR